MTKSKEEMNQEMNAEMNQKEAEAGCCEGGKHESEGGCCHGEGQEHKEGGCCGGGKGHGKGHGHGEGGCCGGGKGHGKGHGHGEGGCCKKEEEPEDEDLNNKYLRLMADFQNFRRRTEKEKSDIYAYANEKIVSELLNVIDNFERALEHAPEDDGFSEGMKMIFKQLQDVLEKSNVKEIEALGQDFDPNFHNAVMMEDSEEFESGKVTCVLQKGYLLNDKVVRPAMVKVAN